VRSVIGVATRLPLSALLSHVLVAFTIEFDNEFERQFVGAAPRATFLVSMVMWSNFMRCVGDEGVPVHQLSARAGISEGPIHPSLAGMERWGYVVVAPNPADGRPKPPRRDWMVHPTPAGRRASGVWRPLSDVIETRWQERFGADEIGTLRASLQALVDQLDVELPHYLPVVKQGMFAGTPRDDGRVVAEREGGRASGLDLPALLSQVLLAFTIEFERESEVSLPMMANVVRVLDEQGVRLRDLPHRAGVSKQAISMAVKFLEQQGYVRVEPDPAASRTKRVRLTAKGRDAQDVYPRLLSEVEQRWAARFGTDLLRTLRESLERLVGAADGDPSPLSAGLVPHAGGWRASRAMPDGLPHSPMVLHRGGWPDGS
jgi:DNA-binding MarR family transcriptional regulator